jgi:hypothetical protein
MKTTPIQALIFSALVGALGSSLVVHTARAQKKYGGADTPLH